MNIGGFLLIFHRFLIFFRMAGFFCATASLHRFIKIWAIRRAAIHRFIRCSAASAFANIMLTAFAKKFFKKVHIVKIQFLSTTLCRYYSKNCQLAIAPLLYKQLQKLFS